MNAEASGTIRDDPPGGHVRRGPRRVVPDLAIVVAVFIAGLAAGGSYRRVFVASGAPEESGVYLEFGAAVALACGHGFVDTGYALTPALADFLQYKRDQITCADLPKTIPPVRPNLTQGLYRYLMSAAALVWMLSGAISWSGLTPLFALAYALTLVAAYGIFRVGIGRVMSVAGTCALLVSAVHLGFLPYLRDYAKAPFVLGLILITVRLAARPLIMRRALGYAVAFGLVLGIGFGFRNDLLINVAPWAAVVLLCLPGPLLSNLKLKALCLAASAVVFVVTAWPILTAYSRGSNSGHVAFLGLMSSFDRPLGVAGAIYDWGYFYDDGFANRVINSFSYRQHGRPVAYLTPEYDRAMVGYLLTIARHWPADIVARAYGSALKVVDTLPFGIGAYTNPIPYGIRNRPVLAVYRLQMSVLRTLAGTGTVAVVLALLVISARSVRLAVALLLFLLYFAGYPAIQFSPRHFFHLEFIAWWAIAFLIERTCVALWRLFRGAGSVRVPPALSPERAAARVGVFAVAGVLLVAGPLVVLRWYQVAHVRALLEGSYLRAEREPVAVVKSAAAGGRVLMDMPMLWQGRNTTEDTSTEYIVAEFSPQRCEALRVPATFRYQGAGSDADFSHDVSVAFGDGDQPTLVFFPALYSAAYQHFQGIELPAADVDCLASVSRVRHDRIPEVLLDVTFAPHWTGARLYQTLASFEAPSDGEPRPARFSSPSSLTLPLHPRLAPFALANPDSEYLAPTVRRHPDGSLVIKGLPESRYSKVLLINDQRLPMGGIVMARGEVRSGGISLGLIRDDAWLTKLNVASKGAFVAAVAVPQAGTYMIALANFVPGGWIESHVPATLAGWLLSLPFLRRENDVTITSLGWAQSSEPPVGAIP